MTSLHKSRRFPCLFTSEWAHLLFYTPRVHAINEPVSKETHLNSQSITGKHQKKIFKVYTWTTLDHFSDITSWSL